MTKITVKGLYDRFPKALKSFREYILPVISYAGEGEPPVELPVDVQDEVIDVILSNTPRTLYDFFDSKKLFISIINDGDEQSWHSSVSGTEFTEDSNDRKEAEQKAFMQAFKILENE